MKLISKLFLIIVFHFLMGSTFSQDIIYTISGEYEGQNITLDSILFENLSNGGRLIFNDLPVQDQFIINLTTQELTGFTGIPSIHNNNVFRIAKCIPGRLNIAYSGNYHTDVSIDIYNIKGQKVYSLPNQNLYGKESINILLGKVGIYLVKLQSSNETKVFRGMGTDNQSIIQIAMTDQGSIENNELKSELNQNDFDFSAQVGDSLRISAFMENYNAMPAILSIDISNEIIFTFYENSFLKINNDEYTLSEGMIAHYGDFEGKGIYNHTMYLLSPDHNINWETLETTDTGAVIDFEIFNTKDTIENGIYTFSIPEDMNNLKVCDSIDRNDDGLINDDDCIFTMPDGKFYISSRISVYDSNANLYEMIGLKFQSGSVAISIEKEQYWVEFDCLGENGDRILGFYVGSLQYYDFSNK